MNIQPILQALDIQEEAARAQADDLRRQIEGLQTRLREAETHLEHLAITRKTVTSLADRLPASPPELPEHPDYARILTVFDEATGPLRAKDVCQVLGHELLPKNSRASEPSSSAWSNSASSPKPTRAASPGSNTTHHDQHP